MASLTNNILVCDQVRKFQAKGKEQHLVQESLQFKNVYKYVPRFLINVLSPLVRNVNYLYLNSFAALHFQ